MTTTTNTPSPTARAATIGGSSLLIAGLTDIIVRYWHIKPEYAPEIVAFAPVAWAAVHRYIATKYRYSDGAIWIKLRALWGNPLP